MTPGLFRWAASWRRILGSGNHNPKAFQSALARVPNVERDAWVDVALGIDGIPDDGPDLPAGCVPYLPTRADTVLRLAQLGALSPSDVVVDIGSGAGRTAALIHLLTGASVIGIEVQRQLVAASRQLCSRLGVSRFFPVEGDAVALTRYMMNTSVFFMYCPFSGPSLGRVLDDIGDVARTRRVRVCCVDVELPERPGLELEVTSGEDLRIYRYAPPAEHHRDPAPRA